MRWHAWPRTIGVSFSIPTTNEWMFNSGLKKKSKQSIQQTGWPSTFSRWRQRSWSESLQGFKVAILLQPSMALKLWYPEFLILVFRWLGFHRNPFACLSRSSFPALALFGSQYSFASLSLSLSPAHLSSPSPSRPSPSPTLFPTRYKGETQFIKIRLERVKVSKICF